MKKTLLATACVLFFGNAGAQLSSHRTCGTMDQLNQQLENDPEFARQFHEEEGRLQQETANRTTQANMVYTSPVVFHVVYKNAAQNITDAQLQSQIEVLNEDYHRLNADTSNTPAVWQPPIAGNPQITFCL